MERPPVTIVVDGVEVHAPQGSMLVDAAKGGDVEIPVFCYEPKLGGPVGACRMCLVEVEGIPKLQTACSTPIRDGMVVYTQTERVREAQSSVVEFLLVNHPLDCPVCDKGGECPLQDIAMGWGPGRSRVTDPKRHFRKPIPLSPLVRIDRERCILCYRCVRFSQEVTEDEQLQLLERGANTYVGTFNDRPYIAPFHGNIIELCPVGALTSEAYRFRARPWDIEDAGSICTLCPSQCNVRFTVRDERVARVMARDNEDVDGGWLCDKGRFGFQMIHSDDRITAPMVRAGGVLHEASWDEALAKIANGLRAAGTGTAVLVGGSASNEEGYLLQRIARGALGSPHVDSTLGNSPGRDTLVALSRPELGASMADLDRADSVLVLGTDPLHSMPILDLRLRRAMRNDRTRVVVASERPTALDGGAEETARYAPGAAAAFLTALAGELLGEGAGEHSADAERIAGELRPGETVIVYGERIGHGPGGSAALAALQACAAALKLDAEGAGLLEVPDGANGRGLREVGCLPSAGPGLSETALGMDATAIRDALEAGELKALVLWGVDPLRELPDPERWKQALGAADFVLEVGLFGNASGGHADVFLPAETHAEKEGTVTHPDGRLQRLRPGIPHPGASRHGWQWLAELASSLGDETGIDSAPEALEAIASEVPFYAGLTHEEIGGKGVRWQERDTARALAGASDEVAVPAAEPAAPSASQPAENVAAGEAFGGGISHEASGGGISSEASGGGISHEAAGDGLRLGTYRDLWAAEVTERSPALRFLVPGQTLELSLIDAERLGIAQGDQVEVRSNGHSVRAKAAIRERVRPGTGFLIEGVLEQNPNVLAGAETVEVTKVAEAPAE